ncbi:hypothetical protein PG984_006529 [Apiospora sp. TS-2023a]
MPRPRLPNATRSLEGSPDGVGAISKATNFLLQRQTGWVQASIEERRALLRNPRLSRIKSNAGRFRRLLLPLGAIGHAHLLSIAFSTGRQPGIFRRLLLPLGALGHAHLLPVAFGTSKQSDSFRHLLLPFGAIGHAHFLPVAFGTIAGGRAGEAVSGHLDGATALDAGALLVLGCRVHVGIILTALDVDGGGGEVLVGARGVLARAAGGALAKAFGAAGRMVAGAVGGVAGALAGALAGVGRAARNKGNA